MATVTAPESLTLLDLEKLCKNFRQNYDGDDVRMANQGQALVLIANSLNRCLARMPRITFSQSYPLTSNVAHGGDKNGSNPLHEYMYRDGVPNARSYRVRIMAATPLSNVSNSFMSSNAANLADGEHTGFSSYWSNEAYYPQYLGYREFGVERGDRAAANVTHQIYSHDGFQAVDVVVQDTDLKKLDTSTHDAVLWAYGKSGNPVLENLMSNIRTHLHTLRTENLPMDLMWAACGQLNTWQAPATTNAAAIVVSSTSYVNLLDQTWTTRNSDSPGTASARSVPTAPPAARGPHTWPAP